MRCCSSDQRHGWSPLTWARPGRVSVPSGYTFDGTAHAEDTGKEVDIHLGRNGKGGGGVLDYGGIHPEAPEHSRTVHRYAITVRPV